jgi:hypothetical protein
MGISVVGPIAESPFKEQDHRASLTSMINDGIEGLVVSTAFAPHWSMAKIDFTYECSNCGAQIRQTVTKPELLN